MPKVLFASALLWPNIGRLCRAFRNVGFDVGAIAVAEHPVHRANAPNHTFVYYRGEPRESLFKAIAEHRPDMVIPCDDRVLDHLCHLWATGDRDLAGLIETSLGRAGANGELAKRGTLGEISGLPNVKVPRTDNVASVADLRDWARRYGLPAVLKLDGSWGGQDVVVVRNEADIRRAFLEMSLRRSVLRRLKRYVIDRDVEALRFRRRAAISVQSYALGRPANVAVACWRGEVIAQVAVDVVQSASRFGMATVVRVVDGDAMVSAARSICGHYNLSGLLGFDFVVDDETGSPSLLEINARATQVGHFPLGPGRDLAAALFAVLNGDRALASRPPLAFQDIALFPQEWLRDRQSGYLSSAFHDLPTEDPELARYYGFDMPDHPKAVGRPLGLEAVG